MFKDSYWAWEGVLDKAFCDHALARLDWDKATGGLVHEDAGELDKKIRITEVLWEEYTAPIAAIAFYYTHLANKVAKWNFQLDYPQPVQVGRYAKDGHYDWHADTQSVNEEGMQRKLSCSILLNDASEYEGGDLEFKGVSKPPPKARGTVIVFPSLLYHRVVPVTQGVRYSAVCWTLGPAFK